MGVVDDNIWIDRFIYMETRTHTHTEREREREREREMYYITIILECNRVGVAGHTQVVGHANAVDGAGDGDSAIQRTVPPLLPDILGQVVGAQRKAYLLRVIGISIAIAKHRQISVNPECCSASS
jgi:hypothetical protein